MSRFKWLVSGVLGLVLVVLVWTGWRFVARPSLQPYAGLVMPTAPAKAGQLRVTFLGVSSLLLDDGQTALLTDGFFSRPAGRQLLTGPIAPDPERIAQGLARAGIQRLAAVFALHSHYDHVLDSPEVAKRTGATLYGSPSTVNVGLGSGLAPQRLQPVHDKDVLTFGQFEVTVIVSAHLPHGLAMGQITEPLRPPARANEYREGGSYQLLVRHRARSLLINGSAGFVDDALTGRHADVVFLGIGGLGRMDQAYRQAYWEQTVKAVRAQRVIPIHWDDFTEPLNGPAVPSRLLFDDLDVTMAFLKRSAHDRSVDVRLAPVWQPIDPFEGLPQRVAGG